MSQQNSLPSGCDSRPPLPMLLKSGARSLPFLEPGQATTVLFPDFVLVPAVVYELQATVDIPDDDVPDNNSWELIFIQNAP